MSDPLVTIARFHSPDEAHLARARLESLGVDAVVANEHSARMLHGWGTPEPTIELRVRRSQAEHSIALLTDSEPQQHDSTPGLEAPPEEPSERCGVCQASFVQIEPRPLPVRILLFLLSALVPIPDEVVQGQRRVCGVCGHRWRADEEQTSVPPPILR